MDRSLSARLRLRPCFGLAIIIQKRSVLVFVGPFVLEIEYGY
jgi:hypothetical protein